MTVPSVDSLEAPSDPPDTHFVAAAVRPEFRGFREHYSTHIRPHLEREAQGFRNRQRTAKVLWVFCIAMSVITAWAVWRYGWDSHLYLFTTALAACLVSGIAPFLITATGHSAIDQLVIPEICRFLGLKYRFSARDADVGIFQESGLLPEPADYDRRDLEDHFRGTRHGVEFEFLECSLLKAAGGETQAYDVVHRAVLLQFRFPERFRGHTLVLGNQGALGNTWRSIGMRGERIQLEDPRHARMFEAWGSHPVHSRNLLSPEFMQAIVALAESFAAGKYEFCFQDNLLLLSLQVFHDQFERRGIFTDIMNTECIERILDQVGRIYDIVDTLNHGLGSRA